MGLTSSLFTGLTGLNANQTWLNVIGNNIANVNTVAFKASSIQFTPQFYITDAAGTAPNGSFGGTNPSQEGQGTQVSTVTPDFTPGAIQTTGVDTNLAVNGSGFFILNSGNGQQFTRDGSFTLNSSDQLVTSTGAYVQGYAANANGSIIPGQLSNLVIPVGSSTLASATKNASFQGNLNSGGQIANGASILTSQAFGTVGGTAPTSSTLLTDLRTTAATPAQIFNVADTLSLAGTRGSSQLASSTLAISPTTTVGDLENFINQSLQIQTTLTGGAPAGPTPGATLQTSGTTGQLTIIGNTGTQNALTLGNAGLVDTPTGGGTPFNPFAISTGSDGAFTNDPTGESTSTALTLYDSLGTPLSVNLTTALESQSTAGDTWRFYVSSPDNEGGNGPVISNGTLTFNNAGQLIATTGTTISINRAGTGAATPLNIDLNFSNMTGFSSTSSNLVMSTQDGTPIGSLSAFNVGADGTVTGNYTNGLTQTLGQVALATFGNDAGLENVGGNVYVAGANSGVPQIGPPETNAAGSVQSGALEESNVDLSKEFINLIIASTGFNAASKVISTSDQLLEALIQNQR